MAFSASIWSLVGRCRGLHNNCLRKYRLPSLVCHGKFAHPITDPHSDIPRDTRRLAISKRNLFLSCNCFLSNQNLHFGGKSNTHPWIYEHLQKNVSENLNKNSFNVFNVLLSKGKVRIDQAYLTLKEKLTHFVVDFRIKGLSIRVGQVVCNCLL